MEVITADWLKERLGSERGARVALAEALGVKPDIISKMLSGVRQPQAREIPLILKFFEQSPSAPDPELVAVWSELEEQERAFLINAARAQIAARNSAPEKSDEE